MSVGWSAAADRDGGAALGLAQKLALNDNEGDDGSRETDRTARTALYSAREALRRKDFAQLEGDELDEIKQLMTSMHWELETRRTRRLKPSPEATASTCAARSGATSPTGAS